MGEYINAKKHYDSQEYQQAYNILLKLAEQGHIKSQAIIASMLEEGKGVKSDRNQALYWYEKAAYNNHAQALYIWAIHNFEALEKIDEGKKYLEKSVSLACPEAIHFLATCLDIGEYGYVKDEERAINLYKKACLLRYKMSCSYLYNILVEKNKKNEFREFVNREMGSIVMFKLMVIPYIKECVVNTIKKLKPKGIK